MGEAEELYNLIHHNGKRLRLIPIHSLELLDETKLPTTHCQKRSLLKKKLSTLKEENLKPDVIFKPKLPKSFYITKLRDWAEEIPVIGLLPEWERNILQLIPKASKKHYPKCLEKLLEEIRSIYMISMQQFTIESIVVKDDKENNVHNVSINEFHKANDEQQRILFLKHRKSLAEKYFLSHNLMKHIIMTAHSTLLPIIVDFMHYPNLGLLQVADLQTMITKSIRNGMLKVKCEYYREVERAISNSKSLQKISDENALQFMRCTTNLFVQQIMYTMMASIQHMIDTMKDYRYCPQIDFKLVCDNGKLTIEPSIKKICNMYHQVIIDIENIGQHLLSFKSSIIRKPERDYINVKVPNWFLEKSHNDLQKAIIEIFEPLNRYISKIDAEFCIVCTPETKANIVNLVSHNQSFHVYCELVNNFNNYLHKANAMVSFVYYNVGRLDQTKAKETLKDIITEIINILVGKLVAYHKEFNQTICREFEALETQALDVPNNAKALFGLSEQMAIASNMMVNELENKIEESVQMLSALLEITSLSEQHIELNKKTINWLSSIKSIFNQSNTLCEAMKSELEDELQKKINVLNGQVDGIVPELLILDDMDDIQRVHEYMEYLNVLVRKIEVIDETIDAINMEEKLFKFPETLFPKLEEIKDIILPFYSLNRMIFQWRRHHSVWLDGPFEYIDATDVKQRTLFNFDQFTELCKSMKTKIKLDMSANKPFRFSGIIDDPDPMQQPAPLKLCFQALEHVKEFKRYVPMVNCMGNPALANRHWREMSRIFGADLTPNAGTTLRKMIGLDLMMDIDKYEAISISANKELALQKQLEIMSREWDGVSFVIEYNNENKLSFINLQDIQTRLEEHLVLIHEMKGSYFVKPIACAVSDFYQSLIQIRDTIDQWNHLQDEYLYLQPVFCSRIFSVELEQVKKAYLRVDKTLDDVKGSIMRDPTFQGIGSRSSEYLNQLQEAMKKVEAANEGVCAYLDNMRLIFPRFFFLSNSELVAILFEQDTSYKITLLLRKCFYGVQDTILNAEMEVISIISDQSEELSLKNAICCASIHTNDWLMQAESAIIGAVRDDIVRHLHSAEEIPSRKICSLGITIECITQLFWTSSIQQCILKFHPAKMRLVLNKQNAKIVSTINNLKYQVTAKQRIILMHLTVILLHQRDITKQLIERNVSVDTDFHWIAQLRYYWHEDNVQVQMLNSSRSYGYEFRSTQLPIINTLLTDRCYRSIFEASRHHFFGALIGHAATGKIETIKGLTRALAVQLQLIHCTEYLSCERVSRVIKGLITCGAWICFKDINATKLSVLSAVTQQIYLISQILSSTMKLVSFDGMNLTLNSSGFIITTMNPGYSLSPRYDNNLPDNLKVRFRSVILTRPDFTKICQVKLFAAGFDNAASLAMKIESIYRFCLDQLAPGKRYNFGSRAVTAVLKTTIGLKFQFPEEDEHALLLRSLVDVNVPMLLQVDIIIFQGFLRDIFPQVTLPPPNYMPLLKALDQVAKSDGFQVHQVLKLKIIQVLEMMHMRHAFTLIGDSFVGKTTILRALAKCLSLLKTQGDCTVGVYVKFQTINQKSVTVENFFGHLDQRSRKWSDGIYSALLRNYSQDEAPAVRKWIILDGPIDSVWMENLSTVLDDNKTLFLSSGESIEMRDSMSIILETDSLEDASPATISCCGIIYVEPQTIGWRPLATSWILEQKLQRNNDIFLKTLLDWCLDPCLDFVYGKCTFIVTVSRMYLAMSMLRLLGIYLKDALNSAEERDKDYFGIWCQAALILSIVWTIGGALCTDSRVALNGFCISLWSNDNKNNPRPDAIKQFDIALPCEGLIHDNTYIFKGVGVWKHWGDILKTESAGLKACGLVGYTVIPTIDIIKHIHIFTNHVKYRIPFIVCGDSSTGKTSCMQYLLKSKLPRTEYLTNTFVFPPTFVAHQAQWLILSKINRIMAGHYAPPKNKFCINFIDDLNMIADINSQSHSVLELIRQYMDHGHWYDLKKPEKLFLSNVIFLCAMTLKGQRTSGCSRFIRHFNLYTLESPTTESIFRIFSNILLYNLKKNLFTADVTGSINNMVNATIHVYTAVLGKLKPSPMNVQYQFNLRDITRVINGCSLIHRESAETKVTLIRLWAHESLRVFGDRIMNNDESEWLFLTIKEAIKAHFKDTFESVFDYLPKENDQLTKESFKSLIFANFMDADREPSNRRYEEVSSKEVLRNKIMFYLNEMNNNSDRKLDILILSEVLEHLIRICRTLGTPCANLLMLCTGGSGRRSLTCLAAFIEKQDFFELAVSPYYNLNQWREDLKSVLKICGGSGKDCTFFIPGKHLKDTTYLEDINSLLTTGEVPNLISPEERQTIIEIARLPAQNGDRNLEIGITDVMDYFFNQCREKLHFIIYFNVSDKNLCRQLKLFPSLLNCCLIDCFTPWPVDAFIQLGNQFVADIQIDSSTKTKIIIASKYFYDQSKEISVKYRNHCGRVTHVSPSVFIHMMRLYAKLMMKKQRNKTESRNRYIGGLKKLQLAAEQVTQMQTTLTALRPQLEWSAKQTEDTMREIESENMSVEIATIQVKSDEEIANKTAVIAATLKAECEADLAVAIPILEDAIAALNTLKPTDITLVKAMKNPPDTVKLVMAAVCVMLGVSAERIIDPVTGRKSMDFWGPSKRVLGDMNFLQNLKDYEKDNIPPALMQVVNKTYMTDKNFMPHIVAKASSAAEGLCKWVRAMVSYDEVAKVVAPKKEKLAAAEKDCNETLAFLNEKRKTLAALNEKLTALKINLQATLAKKLELEIEVESCTQKLIKAEALIMSLGGEKIKWMQSADNLKKAYDNLAGDILLSCGVVAYLGPYHPAYRDHCVTLWQKYVESLMISCSSNYNFVDSLESTITINSWYLSGLPKNRFALENAVILKNSLQWCLFIDPQNQANLWIKEMERQNGLKVVKLTDPDYLFDIERSIELGCPVLLENLEEDLIVSLNYILSQRIYRVGDNLYQEINHRKISFNPKFRLYMTTRLHNPHFDADLFRKTTVINFLLPDDALQGRLLDIVISRERPELQEKFDLLLIQSASNERVLKQEEENILTILSMSTINILEDEKAMRILDSSKNLSMEIRKKEEAVRSAKQEIDVFRRNYNALTSYCATLYNTLTALSNLNCMYRFSLTWFTQLYVKSIATSSRSIILEKRLEYLKSSFTRTLHSSVLNALLTKHKLLYSFVLCLKMLADSQQISSQEIELFTSDACIEVCDMTWKSSWLPEKSWEQILMLSKRLPAFHGLEKSIQDDESSWREYYNLKNPENQCLPKPWNESLTPFQKMMILKIIRPDRTVVEISHFVSTMRRHLSAESTPNLSQSYSESSCLIPLIFILPSYLEPLKLVQEFGAELGYSSKLITASLGANQDQKVRQMILQAQKEGGWVFLQNCHLASSWMPQLEKIYEDLDTSNTALGFRLWLSSYPTRQFPIGILQNGVKITRDAPTNLKQTLINCYHSDPLNKPEFFNSCPGKDKIFSKILYTFCVFHAVIRERNNFGIQGWNVKYDFCHSDLAISIRQLQSFLKNTNKVPFEALFYLVGECNYGGKIMDISDSTCLMTILHDFYNEQTITQCNYSPFFNGFTIPDRCEYHDFTRHIESLPNYSVPEVFGVDENAGIVKDTLAVKDFLYFFNQLNEQVDNEELLQQKITDKIKEIQEKLPVPLDTEEAIKKYPINSSNPLNAILIQEITTCNSVLELIEKSLMSDVHQRLFELSINIVPSTWLTVPVSYEHRQSLSKFIEDFNNQFQFFQNWIDNGCPPSFWLGAFAFPKRFISAAHTMFIRQYDDQSIDRLFLHFEVLSIKDPSLIEIANKKYIHIHGLHLGGARWDLTQRKLKSSHPKIFTEDIPIIRCTSCVKRSQIKNFYLCPSYKSIVERDLINYSGESSNFIMQVPLATDLPNAYWIKNGAALFCRI